MSTFNKLIIGNILSFNFALFFKRTLKRLMNPGSIVMLSACFLTFFGVEAIGTTRPLLADRHLTLGFLGIFFCLCFGLIHFKWLEKWSMPLYVSSLLILFFVLMPIVPNEIVRPRNGARRWINLGFTDFQPSEIAKITYLLVLATHLRWQKNHRFFSGLILPFLYAILPMSLIIVEPDLGTSLLFLPSLFAVLWAAGARIRHLALIVIIGIGSAFSFYKLDFLKSHQKERIHALIDSWSDNPRLSMTSGYQGDRARMLVSAGGVNGVDAKNLEQVFKYRVNKWRDEFDVLIDKKDQAVIDESTFYPLYKMNSKSIAELLLLHNHLPEEHNDMIFSVICLRWGLWGACLALGGVLIFVISGLIIAARSRDPFARLLAVGISVIIGTQAFINAGMTLGLAPITGLSFPFVSYGGSSLVSTWIMVGLLVGIAFRRNQFMAPRDVFAFGD